MDILEQSRDVLDLYKNKLPDTIYAYKKATIDDMSELVRTRVIILRAANKLSEDVDMAMVEKKSYDY